MRFLLFPFSLLLSILFTNVCCAAVTPKINNFTSATVTHVSALQSNNITLWEVPDGVPRFNNTCCVQNNLWWYRWTITLFDNRSIDKICGKALLGKVRKHHCLPTARHCGWEKNGTGALVRFSTHTMCTVRDIGKALEEAYALDVGCHFSPHKRGMGACPANGTDKLVVWGGKHWRKSDLGNRMLSVLPKQLGNTWANNRMEKLAFLWRKWGYYAHSDTCYTAPWSF